jgi:hypothetical protein
MTEQKFPAGWDQSRVEQLIAHYDQMSDEEWVADDEAAAEAHGQTLMVVPTDLVPRVRELIAHVKG